jgi:two-component system, OmpR family, alkaline phosphatase synthesis response regulator PhoP
MRLKVCDLPERAWPMTRDTNYGTILVVDDHVEILALVKAFLEHAGYSVATAADGIEGLRYYRRNQSSILLLLTDVRMPGMNGLDLADRVLGMDSQLPVVFMSGDPWGAHRGLECLAKPFRPAELLERVNRALNGKARSASTVPAA